MKNSLLWQFGIVIVFALALSRNAYCQNNNGPDNSSYLIAKQYIKDKNYLLAYKYLIIFKFSNLERFNEQRNLNALKILDNEISQLEDYLAQSILTYDSKHSRGFKGLQSDSMTNRGEVKMVLRDIVLIN